VSSGRFPDGGEHLLGAQIEARFVAVVHPGHSISNLGARFSENEFVTSVSAP
jgi:hypothetical protein